MLSPATPTFSSRVYTQLGFQAGVFDTLRLEDAAWGGLKAGHVFPKAKPLFQRVEGELVTSRPQGGA